MSLLKKISITLLLVFGLLSILGEHYLLEIISGTPAMIFRTLFWIFAIAYAVIRVREISRRKRQNSE